MPPAQRQFIWKALFFILLFYLVLNMGELFKRVRRSTGSATVEPRVVVPAPGSLTDEEQNTIRIFEARESSVVAIKNAALARDFFSLNVYEVPRGAGSGVIWDQEGHIVTNFHVIFNADKIEVALSDGSSHEARIQGIAPDYDLAVLKIDADPSLLHPIPLGTSMELKVGQKVLVLGNPFGLTGTLTTGIISALGRTIESPTRHKIFDVIQTDAAINPGNSGGPLLDTFGRMIGVNTAIVSASGASAGIGFAVPVDTVNRVVPQLIARGRIQRAGFGITLVPNHIRQNLGIQGALIMQVIPGGAAEKAGLKGTRQTPFSKLILGDVIVALDGQAISNNESLVYYLDQEKSAGESVAVTYLRNKQKHTATLTLQPLG